MTRPKPKKVNISFVLLILLFTLSQTAFILTASLSYDNAQEAVQGQNIQSEESNILSVASISSNVVTHITDNVMTYYAEPEMYLSMPKLEAVNAELTVYNDVDTAIAVVEPEEPAPAPIKSVVKHVNANKLNVRSEPTSSSDLVTSITRGDKVTYYETVGEWARIITWTDKKGYVLAKHLVDSANKVERVVVQQPATQEPKEDPVVASRSEPEATPISAEGQNLADEIVAYAKTLLGVPYRYGGYSTKGLDCSGFTKYVFAKFGIDLPRSSYSYDSEGTKVSRSDLQKGDILLWDSNKNGTIGHVGIYIGDGMFIHASSSKGKVVTRSVSSYGEKYMGARRVLK